ncbi:MAG: carboxypeptidase-like regulatory domain-containing protein [Cytophagales bacterium]|nr:carboxypeptidase-like regulatory domain-containing protein [Cytophagales bacterium]MCA6373700.1 carboxypeptidase-like regulatory domain-containing protein [Cytophagales bacterium]MCA6376453.1 carboxypeptidase-like regulatory domain-containing protein [Cytophagales bacterium]MCA6385988.1 carboxypeptidase-like regulatory domain-containing protein [Cytophagales bacterium]
MATRFPARPFIKLLVAIQFTSIAVKWADKFCPFFVYFFTICSISQVKSQSKPYTETFSIRGIVKSTSDSVRIPYAHVYLLGKVTGTITNSEGEFELKVPIEIVAPEVIFSAMGYKTKSVAFGVSKIADIFLEETIYKLDEVVISSNGFDSASYILKRAIQFIKFNYPSKSHLIEGFFRELSLKDTTYTRLIEAAVLVQEKGYNKQYFKNGSLEETKSRVKIIELRKSDDFREYSLLDRLSVLIFGERNELYMILRGNYVNILGTRVKEHFLAEQNIEKYLEWEYEGKAEWNGLPVYVVSLKTPARSGSFRLENLKFYINQSDFAIVRIEHIGLPNTSMKEIQSSWLIEGKYFDRTEVTYRKITTKYFPVLIRSTRSAYGASATVKSGDKIQKQYVEILFLLNRVYQDNYSKIKWKDAEERDEDLYKREMPYNEKFWNSYNMVILSPLKRGAADLERKQKLNEQFKQN